MWAGTEMIRSTLLFLGLAIGILASGCCGPMGCGPGCEIPCNDCAGVGVAGNYISNGPLEGLRNWRKGLTCGYGCGETYVDEWISTPPDCSDPCCNEQWVGGAVASRPFCRPCNLGWQPGMLLGGLYGKRYCSGDASSTPCAGCGDVGCGGCGDVVVDSGYVDTSYSQGQVIDSGVIMESAPVPAAGGSSGCGCASCATPGGTRLAHMPTKDSITSRAQQAMDVRARRIRR